MIKLLSAFILISTSSFADSPRKNICPQTWTCEMVSMKVPYNLGAFWQIDTVKIRAGYLKTKAPFRGNIIYYQGLGDSMLNHAPFFKKLQNAGYRVIAFDYMGQGGSEGKMNRTRIKMIPAMGNVIWKRFAKDLERFPQKYIIGWSTGGLAAFTQAVKADADKVALIAPGVAPKKIVGSGLPFNKITLETLTAADYLDGSFNPHVDPIKPASPLLVPAFSIDLLTTAFKYRNKRVSERVQGLVLVGGDDNYVKPEKTLNLIRKNAPMFETVYFQSAKHEIHNETPEIREEAHQRIIDFFER